jgi:hypothetical protein
MCPIQLPQCTPQQFTIDGTWQNTDAQLRFIGRLASAAPFVILSLRKSGAAYQYLKHPGTGTRDVAVHLSQRKVPQTDHYHHTFTLARGVPLSTQSTGRVFLSGTLPLTFPAGVLFPFAVDRQQQPCICLLALAQGDVTVKRNGVWAVHPPLVAQLEAAWRHALSTTRQGVIRVAEDGGGPGSS